MDESLAALRLSAVPEHWRDAPRRWGHPLHAMCSYFAMFPPQIASVFIRWLTQPGDVVYDPFSGRGTVPLEALLYGRVGLGSDANPLATALTTAKVRIPSASAVSRRLEELEESWSNSHGTTSGVPDAIRMLYAPGTLRQLVFLRERLGERRRVDPFITGLVLGMLHANHSAAGATRGFSISMPNTFAMGSNYVRDYIERNNLIAPELDVFAMLHVRAKRYRLPEAAISGGKAWAHDATQPAPAWLKRQRPRLIFTSPPYLQVIKYGKYNWVRLWFLGNDAHAVDADLIATSSLPRYLGFMSKVLVELKKAVAADGHVCLVIGDVRKGAEEINLAGKVWRHVAEPAGWHSHGIIADEVPDGRKVSRIWKTNPGRATKTDRILMLSPSQAPALPAMDPIDWSHVPSFESRQRQETEI